MRASARRALVLQSQTMSDDKREKPLGIHELQSILDTATDPQTGAKVDVKIAGRNGAGHGHPVLTAEERADLEAHKRIVIATKIKLADVTAQRLQLEVQEMQLAQDATRAGTALLERVGALAAAKGLSNREWSFDMDRVAFERLPGLAG